MSVHGATIVAARILVSPGRREVRETHRSRVVLPVTCIACSISPGHLNLCQNLVAIPYGPTQKACLTLTAKRKRNVSVIVACLSGAYPNPPAQGIVAVLIKSSCPRDQLP